MLGALLVFNSLTFIPFMLGILGFHLLHPSWRARKLVLLVASYAFYCAWHPPFVLLLWISTVLDWFVARRLARTQGRQGRLALVWVSVAINLGMLAYFKYANFLLESLEPALSLIGVAATLPELDILLPVGISFFTFQTLSYTIDVYRGDLEPSEDFLDYALFVTFFPQLVAGPIVRASHFLPQLRRPTRVPVRQIAWGLVLLLVGVFAKAVFADQWLGPVVDRVYGAAMQVGTFDAWVGTLAFSGQIYFDFSGYSIGAIGVAMMLGFDLPDNFRHPYAAQGFSDFWRRWHMSLSTWLRDYLYISLGGNRGGLVRTYVNLCATMLLGGLWHGASWNFVVWGALHGAYLVVERLLRGQRWTARVPFAGVWATALTYVAVCYAWVFFRADTLGNSLALVGAMTVPDAARSIVDPGDALVVLVTIAGMLGWQRICRDSTFEDVVSRFPVWLLTGLLAALIAGLFLFTGDSRAFIYFQF